MSTITHEVRPGGLARVDHDVIFDLAERGLSANQIAIKLLAHPSTVQWFMYRHGLTAPAYKNRKPYLRNGRLVVAFSPEEDAYIEALRIAGVGRSEIARRTTAKFGNQRSPMTIGTRLVMLAARDDVGTENGNQGVHIPQLGARGSGSALVHIDPSAIAEEEAA